MNSPPEKAKAPTEWPRLSSPSDTKKPPKGCSNHTAAETAWQGEVTRRGDAFCSRCAAILDALGLGDVIAHARLVRDRMGREMEAEWTERDVLLSGLEALESAAVLERRVA